MLKSPLKKNTWMEKILCWDFFLKKVQNASQKKVDGEISIQNGDFSILNGENSLLRFVFKKKVQNASEKKWMEKSPFRMEISPFWMEKILCWDVVFQRKSSKRFSKKSEWRNLHSEWRFLHSIFLNGENSLLRFVFKKNVPNHFWKKFEWRNLHSEWRFLHSEWRKFSVYIFFKRRFKTLLKKKVKWRKSPFRMEISPFCMEKILCWDCF